MEDDETKNPKNEDNESLLRSINIHKKIYSIITQTGSEDIGNIEYRESYESIFPALTPSEKKRVDERIKALKENIITKNTCLNKTPIENYKSIQDQKEETTIKVILESFRKDFQEDNPYAFWLAIQTCNHYNIIYPIWVKSELQRIAKRLTSLENTMKSYPDQIAQILNMTGHGRRHTEAKRQDSKIWAIASLAIKRGDRRIDTISFLRKNFHINTRHIEAIYDKAKKEFIELENM